MPSIIDIKPFIWIPPSIAPAFRVEVIRADGTIDDVTNFLESLTIEEGVTEEIGNFSFQIPNFNNEFADVWTGMEQFKFYSDYASTATTLRFIGRLEKPFREENSLKCQGRSESLFVMDEMVTQSYVNSDCSAILNGLFQKYGSRFDLSSIPSSTGVTLTVDWIEKNFWDCLKDVATACNYDCYIDAQLKVNFFPQSSILNENEAIVHEYNLVKTGDFGDDFSQIKNKVRVYGATIDGVQVQYTANDFDSQSKYGIKRETISDDNVVSVSQAQSMAEDRLSIVKIPVVTGEVTGLFLPTIRPGERVRISDPMNGLLPSEYRCFKYKHELGQDGFDTTLTINKSPLRISDLLKVRIENENKAQNTAFNPGDYDYSYVDFFDSTSGTHSNTKIQDGYLLMNGATPGTWTSVLIPTVNTIDIKEIQINVDGSNIVGTTYQISVDGGANYETVTSGVKFVPTFIGNSIKVKIVINGANTQINSYSLQYNTM